MTPQPHMTNPMRTPALPIVILDDDPCALAASELLLQTHGYNNCIMLNDSRELLPLMARQQISVLLLDLTMPHISGEAILQTVTQDFPDVKVIILTGTMNVQSAVEAMKSGAFDYQVKPVDSARLLASVKLAIEIFELLQENLRLRDAIFNDTMLINPTAFSPIVTNDRTVHSIFRYVEDIADSNRPVLITGETGVGKELFAQAIHRTSGRKGKFVPVTIAGLDDTMISDTLFGHARGAYTGAENRRPGLISQAAGGTLFLDEIGDLSENSQIKLLRLLQELEYMPLGSDIPLCSTARIVVATHQDLKKGMQTGTFRRDLFYRLRTHHIKIPPLRHRLNDIPPLLEHFMEKSAKSLGCRTPTVPPELFDLLRHYSFPGNIRELETMVYDAVSHHTSGPLSLLSFIDYIDDARNTAATPSASAVQTPPPLIDLILNQHFPTLKESAEFLVQEALRRTGGNQRAAARLLGISPPALSKRIKKAADNTPSKS